jgi:sugar phosphate isomerase/epimerase
MGSWAFTFGPNAAQPKSLPEVAQRLARAGFDGIELCGFPPHVTLERYHTPGARQELRRLLEDLGLGVSGYSADFTSVTPTDPANRQEYLDLFRRQAEQAREIGSPSLRFDTMTAPGCLPDSDYQATLHRLADLWRDCADFARDAQVVMLWEFEPGFIFNKPSEVVGLHQKVGHPWFQVLFDTAHAYMSAVVGSRHHEKAETLGGGVGEFLDLLHDAVGGVHFVDSDGSLWADDTSMHLVPGKGVIPFPELVPKLIALPHVDWWCVDLSFHPDAWNLVEESLSATRALIGQS